MIGRVSFFKDYDTLSHPVEKVMGQWVADFHEQLGPFVRKRPDMRAAGGDAFSNRGGERGVRYTELRPTYLY